MKVVLYRQTRNYKQLNKANSITIHMVFKQMLTTEQRFWSKIDLDWKTGCWNWTSVIDDHGYGRININHKNILAHRYSY